MGDHVVELTGDAGPLVFGRLEGTRREAAQPSPRVVTIMDPRRGAVLRELRHERDVARIVAVPADDMLLSVDADGNTWELGHGLRY